MLAGEAILHILMIRLASASRKTMSSATVGAISTRFKFFEYPNK